MAESVRPKKAEIGQSLLGKNVLVFLNYGEGATEALPKWTLVGGQRSASLSMSADEVDASDKNSGGWGETAQGIKSTELSIEGVAKVGNMALKQIKEAFFAGEAVDILRWSKSGTSERNWYNITEASDEAPHDDVVTFSLTLKGCGQPKFTENMVDPRE